MLKFGDPVFMRLLKKRSQAGEVTPLDNVPTVSPDNEFYWRAFHDLHATRPRSGFGASAIPLESIEAWLNIYNVSDLDERLDVLTIVRSLDDHWLSWARSETSKSKDTHGRTKADD